MEDPMNAALLSQRYTGKKKQTEGICQTRTEDTENPATRGMADASREDVPGGVRSGGDSLENGSKVSSDVMCPGKRGVRVPRYPVVILAVVIQHGAASAENA